jgi:hypothetical protein
MGNVLEPMGTGMVVWNPTNEDFDFQYAGISFVIESEGKRELDMNCARNILNTHTVRGLTSLKYGDEKNEDRIRKDAIARNIDFKKRQVTNYNQQNENRKHMNLGFLPPSDLIKKYASELNLKLLEPYSVRDEERAGISDAKRENEQLRGEVNELREMMKQFLAAKQEKPETVKEPESAPDHGPGQDRPERPVVRPGFKR